MDRSSTYPCFLLHRSFVKFIIYFSLFNSVNFFFLLYLVLSFLSICNFILQFKIQFFIFVHVCPFFQFCAIFQFSPIFHFFIFVQFFNFVLFQFCPFSILSFFNFVQFSIFRFFKKCFARLIENINLVFLKDELLLFRSGPTRLL